MTAPRWIESVVEEFGKAAGIRSFTLNERGAAAVAFENGIGFRLEYAAESLIAAITVPAANSPAAARRILAAAHPMARYGLRLKAGYLEKRSCAIFASRLPDRDVTLPALNAIFAALWRIATEIGGAL